MDKKQIWSQKSCVSFLVFLHNKILCSFFLHGKLLVNKADGNKNIYTNK